MSFAECLSELGRQAAGECTPEVLRDATRAAIERLFGADLTALTVSDLAAPHAPEVPVAAGARSRHGIDVPHRFRLSFSVGAEISRERESWLEVIESVIELWARARRLNAHNRFATDSVDSLRSSSPDDPVVSRLELLAKLARNVKGVEGALVVTLDGDERAAAFGASGIGVRGRDDILRAVNGWLGHMDFRRSGAIELATDSLVVPEHLIVRGYPMFVGDENTGKLVGLLLVATNRSRVEKVDTLLVPFARLANWVVRDALSGEVMRRLRRLQELVLTPNASNPPEVVRALAKIFQADVVSLFLDDHGVLRLAASTDEHLGEGGTEVTYEPGEGITGWVFKHGQPRRFSDASETGTFRRASCNTAEPKHRERAAGQGTTRLLAVPMRHGKTIVGVLRMSRAHEQHHFTQGEEDALSFFGDVLGALVAERWQRQVSKEIQQLTADAVYLARLPTTNGVLDSPIVYELEGASRLYGRSALVGLNAARLYSPSAVRAATERALRNGRSAGPLETFAVLPDGMRRPIELSFRLLQNELFNPPSAYWLVLARDISERKKRTEETERQRAFLDQVRIAYFRCDTSGKTPHATDLDCEITGYSASALAACSRDVLYADPKERAQLVENVRQADGRLLKRLVQLKRKTGEKLVVEADLRLLRDEEGRETGLEGFYREVTDRIMFQDFLDGDTQRLLTDAELYAKLHASATFQQDYLLSLGHQLKAPLVALMATLRNFERRIVREEVAAERMAYVIGQTRVCIDMVHNLSFLGRILRQDPLSWKDVPAARLVIRVKLDLMHLLRGKRLNVIIDDESLDQIGRLWGDPDVLRQVFVNLLDNAIKYSVPDTTVRILGRPYSSHVVIDVINEGLEIPYALRDKIFERGYRTPQAAQSVPHGTGLGLWLVRRMLRLHQARIECMSEPSSPGRARNCFRITFPRQQ